MKRALAGGFLVVISMCVGATVWSVASTLADGPSVYRSFDEHCAEPSDIVFPKGSCARPLHAADFEAGRATLTLTVTPSGGGNRVIDYTYENRTSKYRSLDWGRVELTTPTGARVMCSGDDSTQRYAAPPSSPKASGYGDLATLMARQTTACNTLISKGGAGTEADAQAFVNEMSGVQVATNALLPQLAAAIATYKVQEAVCLKVLGLKESDVAPPA